MRKKIVIVDDGGQLLGMVRLWPQTTTDMDMIFTYLINIFIAEGSRPSQGGRNELV